MIDLTADTPERDALFEDLGRQLYVEAQIDIPPDVRQGLRDAHARESNPVARGILSTMLKAIEVADRKHTLVCQDTGIPIFWITIGRGFLIDGARIIDALCRGVERATAEMPLRSSIVSPIRRENRQTSSGEGVPVVHVEFSAAIDHIDIMMMIVATVLLALPSVMVLLQGRP